MTPEPTGRSRAPLASFPRAAGATVIVVGCLVLVGWALGIPALQSVVPGLVTMKANAALAFVLAGVALWVLGAEQAHHPLRRLGHACAGTAALIGGFTLVEYLFAWNVGLDQLLFTEPPGAVGTFAPGRMAPTTALNFLLLGAALLLPDAPRGVRGAQVLPLTAGMLGLLSLMGYAYDVEPLYGVASYTQMAVHTAGAFIVLSLGVLSARPDRGLLAIATSDGPGGVVARRLLPAAIGVPLLLGWLTLLGQRADLYGTPFGVALFGLSTVIVLATIIWRNAGLLYRAHGQRGRVEAALEQAYLELEGHVEQAMTGLHEANISLQKEIAERERAERELQRLYREEERGRKEAEAFATLAKDLSRPLDLDQVLARLVKEATVLGQADLAFLALVEADGQALSIRAQTGAVSSLLAGVMLPRGRGMVGKALETGLPCVTDEYLQDPLFSHDFDPGARAEGIVAQVAIPILHEGAPLGVLLAARRAARPFALMDIRVLTRLADAATVGFHHALLYRQATTRATILERLGQVGQGMLTPLALPATLDRIVQTARDLLRVDHAVLTVWDETAQDLTVLARAGGEEPRLPRRFRPGEGAHGTVAATHRALVVNDYRAFPGRIAGLANVITATAVVPLLIEDRLIGTLGVYATGRPQTVTTEDLRLLELLAQPASSALANAQQHDAAVRRGEERAALLRAMQSVMAGLDLGVTLERIAEEASRIAGVPHMTVFLVDKKTRVLRPRATAGGATPAEFQIPLGDSFSGIVAATGQPLFVADTRNDPRKMPTQQERGFEFVSYLGIPITVREEVVGVLAFYSTTQHHYGPDDLAYLRSFADQAAIALENARLFDQVRAGRERLQALSRRLVEVQEAERRHIARELHDEIGQVLTGLKLTLETSMRLRADALKTRLGEAQRLVNDLITQVREMSLELRPAMLDDLGLLAALLWHFERFTAQSRVRVTFKHSELEGRRFASEVETTAYRIVQEALTNIARHAGVSEVTVHLSASQDLLSLQIKDQGTGFDPEVSLASGTSTGLAGMRERAELLGGHLTVESAPGAGTRVTVELPLGRRIERRKQKRPA